MCLIFFGLLWPVTKILTTVKSCGRLSTIQKVENILVQNKKIKRFAIKIRYVDYTSWVINNKKQKTILLIHGNNTTAFSTWFSTIEGLNESFNQEYNIHALELPGFGHDDARMKEVLYGKNNKMLIEYYSQYIIDYILCLRTIHKYNFVNADSGHIPQCNKNLNDENFTEENEIILIGHSFGGFLTTHVATKIKINHLLLIAPFGMFSFSSPYFSQNISIFRERLFITFVAVEYYKVRYLFSWGETATWWWYYSLYTSAPMNIMALRFVSDEFLESEWSEPCCEKLALVKTRTAFIICEKDELIAHQPLVQIATHYGIHYEFLNDIGHVPTMENCDLTCKKIFSAISNSTVPINKKTNFNFIKAPHSARLVKKLLSTHQIIAEV